MQIDLSQMIDPIEVICSMIDRIDYTPKYLSLHPSWGKNWEAAILSNFDWIEIYYDETIDISRIYLT